MSLLARPGGGKVGRMTQRVHRERLEVGGAFTNSLSVTFKASQIRLHFLKRRRGCEKLEASTLTRTLLTRSAAASCLAVAPPASPRFTL